MQTEIVDGSRINLECVGEERRKEIAFIWVESVIKEK